MGVTVARRMAFDVLRLVEVEEGYAADLLHEWLSDPRHPLKREDAALATELTLGVLRWQGLLDFLVARQVRRPLEGLDTEVLLALRMGTYQLRFLTRVPARAAVNESVELVKFAGKRSAASLVNAVLRHPQIAGRGNAVERLLPREMSLAERLSIQWSHPAWLVTRWLARWGEPRTLALLEANNQAPHLACAIHETSERDAILREMKKAKLRVSPSPWLRPALRVGGGSVAATESFRKGWISIQDEASQMVPRLLEVKPGQTVLDLCAAPGGKTMTLARAAVGVEQGTEGLAQRGQRRAEDAEAMPQGTVFAADKHAHRLKAMRERFAQTKMPAVQLVALDATQPLPLATQFDRILVDAPCSGTGTLARNPEIRWRLIAQDLGDFQTRQRAMLAEALAHLAPGGRLVYSTCSLEPEENEQVVEEVLGTVRGLRRIVGSGGLERDLAAGAQVHSLFDAQGYFRTFPPEHHTDGFFAAVLEKSR